MTDRELLEMIATQVGSLTNKVDNIEKKVTKTHSIIENDIKPKIKVLFDGHQQNSQKLDRIEIEVSRHEEIILRRIK